MGAADWMCGGALLREWKSVLTAGGVACCWEMAVSMHSKLEAARMCHSELLERFVAYCGSVEAYESRGADSPLRGKTASSCSTAELSAVHTHARRPLSFTTTRASPYLDSRFSTVDTEANGFLWCNNKVGFRSSISWQTSWLIRGCLDSLST